MQELPLKFYVQELPLKFYMQEWPLKFYMRESPLKFTCGFCHLKFIDSIDCEKICKIILSGCVLHNLAFEFQLDEDNLDIENEEDPNDCHRNVFVVSG